MRLTVTKVEHVSAGFLKVFCFYHDYKGELKMMCSGALSLSGFFKTWPPVKKIRKPSICYSLERSLSPFSLSVSLCLSLSLFSLSLPHSVSEAYFGNEKRKVSYIFSNQKLFSVKITNIYILQRAFSLFWSSTVPDVAALVADAWHHVSTEFKLQGLNIDVFGLKTAE